MSATFEEKLARFQARGPKPRKPPRNSFGRVNAGSVEEFQRVVDQRKAAKRAQVKQFHENRRGVLA